MLFWVRVLSSDAYDGCLIRRVATEAVKFGRGSWLCKISMWYVLQGIWVARNKDEGCERFVKHRGEGDAGIYCLEEDSEGMGP